MNTILLPLATTLTIQILISGASLTAAVLATLASVDFGVPASSVGFYVAMLYGSAAVSGVASGGIIARFGPLRTMQSGLVLGALSALALAQATIPFAMLAALLGGLSLGPTTPASSAILSRATDVSNRNLVFSIKQTGVPAGFMLAALTLPVLGLALGWRGACLAVACMLAIAAGIVTLLHGRFDRFTGSPVRFSLRGQLVEPLERVWRQAEMRNIAMASFAYSGLQGSLSGFLIVFLLHETSLQLVAAATVLACAQGAGVAGRVVWGIVADRLGRPDIVLSALGLAMAGLATFVTLGAAHLPFAALVAACIAFGGTAMAWNGVYLAEVARLAAPGREAEATGATGLFTYGGVAVMPSVFTTIVLASDSYVVAYLVVAALPGLIGIVLLRGTLRAGISRQ
ncbi:MAG: MFS transporter [Alphaproteobacteria bacterium]|nr:MFS transporter [Alphaproteobacteria bacterium]